MFFKTPTCLNCQQPVEKNASFCPNCGARLAGGSRKCGACDAENRGDAQFCHNCGQPLAQSAAPRISGHRWARPEQEFALRVEADDLPGLLKRGIKVEPGTNAMVIQHGAALGVVPPGEYTLGNIGQRVKDWLLGDIPERVTLLLVDVTPVDYEFNLGGRFTSDPLPIGLTLRVQVEVNEPAKFLVNVLRGRERFSKEEMRQYLYPEIAQVADRWLRQHTLQELVEDSSQRSRLELALEEELRRTFAQTGLRFIQVRAAELNLEPFEAVTGKYSKANLLDKNLAADFLLAEMQLKEIEQKVRAGEETELRLAQVRAEYEQRKAALDFDTKKRLDDLERQRILHDLQQDTLKVETEEQKVALYSRMRQAAMSDKMNEVRSTADFDRFLDAIDGEKLLREKERLDLRRAWEVESEDRELARRRLLDKLEIEGSYELRLAELKLQGEQERETGALDQLKLDNEIALARKRADYEFESRRRITEEDSRLDQERERIENQRRENQIKLDRLQRQQEMDDDIAAAKAGLEILALMKANRRLDEEETLRMRREDELKRAWELHKIEMEKWEAEQRRIVSQQEHELKRLEAMGKLGVEALVTASTPEQAAVLADLKRTEAMRGMSEEQILAMAAERSPDVARALQEKYRAIAEGKASEKEKEIYERLLADEKQMQRELLEMADKRTKEVSEAWDRSSARSQEMAEKAMDRMADTAQAFAKGQSGAPVIITTPGAGSPQVIYTPGSGAIPPAAPPTETKSCPKCGRSVEAQARHCQFCGNKFEGVG